METGKAHASRVDMTTLIQELKTDKTGVICEKKTTRENKVDWRGRGKREVTQKERDLDLDQEEEGRLTLKAFWT